MSSGNTLYSFAPQDNEPTATDFATLDTRNGHPVLDFDASVSERAVFTGWLPRNYSGGGITVTYVWGGTSATTGFAVINGEFERIANGGHDLDSDSFDTARGSTASAPSVSGFFKYTTQAFTSTQIDGLASSGAECFRFRVTRVATATGDDMAGDMELLFVELMET